MTRHEAKTFGEAVRQEIGGRSVSVHVGTWMDRPGASICVHLDSRSSGARIVIHKWDDDDLVTVRSIKGDFWRDPKNAVSYGIAEGVEFTTDATAEAARVLLGQKVAA